MHIAMVFSTSLPPREGIGIYAWNLARQLVSQGQQVDLITRGGPHPTTRQEVEGITIWRPTFLPVYPLHVHLHGLFVSTLIRRLESEIDIFHLHSPLVPFLTTKKPVLLTFHSTMLLDARLTPVESLYALLTKLQAPVSYHLELANIKYSKCVTAVSPWVAKALQSYPNHPANIEIMWNGVDTHTFKPVDNPKQREKLILTVSRLGAGKGLLDLVEAAGLVTQKAPEVRFLIVGEGGLQTALEKLIREKGLEDSIRMAGHISERKRLIDLYRQSALFVLPSRHEGLPTVLLEAMACGCPVLATAVGGIPYVIKDGENGVLVSSGDIQGLGQGILELLDNPQLSSYLGEQARNTVEERFSWEMIGSRYLQQYQNLLQGVDD